MRLVLLFAALALLGACAGPLPAPDPQQAWIELHAEMPSDLLMAEQLDGKRLDDGRYFQVSPGAHRLEVSYRFEVPAVLFGLDSFTQLCYLRLDYAHFAAGQRYRLDARSIRAWLPTESWLSDAQGRRLAEGQELICTY
jgi:hypothetical protein